MHSFTTHKPEQYWVYTGYRNFEDIIEVYQKMADKNEKGIQTLYCKIPKKVELLDIENTMKKSWDKFGRLSFEYSKVEITINGECYLNGRTSYKYYHPNGKLSSLSYKEGNWYEKDEEYDLDGEQTRKKEKGSPKLWALLIN